MSARAKSQFKLAIQYLQSLTPQQMTLAAEYIDEACTETFRPVEVIFPVAFALHALATVKQAGDAVELDAIASYIKQQGQDFSYNYWDKLGRSFTEIPLPDDSDDTACCLSALLKTGQDVDPRFFLKLIKLESKPGGPYRTWYINNSSDGRDWEDIDPVVNAHILYLAASFGIKLPNTEDYLKRSVSMGNFGSRYYPYPIIGLFYLSRYLARHDSAALSELVKDKLSVYKWNKLSHLEKVLLSLSNANLGLPTPTLQLAEIMSWQNVNGSFPVWPMCFGFDRGKKQSTYCSNSVQSTALVVELMQLNVNLKLRKKPKNDIAAPGILHQLKHELSQFQITDLVDAAIPGYLNHRAFKLPIVVAKLLGQVENPMVKEFCLALFYSWNSYTILDNHLDKQATAADLPLAFTMQNLAWSHLVNLNAEFREQILAALKKCDDYYRWELANCRFDNVDDFRPPAKFGYGYIEQRMQPFLTAISLWPGLLDKSYVASSNAIRQFFVHLINIEQLNDDAHDWQDDLKSGNLTFVGWLVLHHSHDRKQLQRIFWTRVMAKVITICETEYVLAAKHLASIPEPLQSVFASQLKKTISPIELAKQEMQKAKELVSYLAPDSANKPD
jgi:hypothetical protein